MIGRAILLVLLLPGAAWAQAAGDVVTCLLKPHQVVQLGSATSGLLVEEGVDRGDPVKAGQVVASLESSVEAVTLALDRVKAADTGPIQAQQEELAFSRRAVDRKQSLANTQVLNANSLDELQTKARQAEIKLHEAETERRIAQLTVERSAAQLANRQIRSSITGVVTERKLSPGEYVYEQTPIMTIAKVDPLNVEVVMAAERYGSIHVGDTATVRPASPSGGARSARVAVVDPIIDAASSTFGVRLLLDNPDGQIPAGIRCTIAWDTPPARSTP